MKEIPRSSTFLDVITREYVAAFIFRRHVNGHFDQILHVPAHGGSVEYIVLQSVK